jgi:predicted 3-demethylubiquinone-9 3-methyltransferase (glyoxalase superfamily)
MTTISPCLWFDRDAEEAARFYVSIFPDSRIDHLQKAPGDWPAGKAGDVVMVEFTLAGQLYRALNGGGKQPAGLAVSLMATCKDQAEVDRIWDGLLQGGEPMQCGWLRDRYGFAWQVIPEGMLRFLADPDPARSRRAWDAMITMVKLDLAVLEAAVNG